MDLDEKFSTKMVIQRIQAWSNSEGYGRNLGIRNWRDEKTHHWEFATKTKEFMPLKISSQKL